MEGKMLLHGEELLMQQGLPESKKYNVGVMLGFIIGDGFLCFLILCYRSDRTRI
ncbi:conserved hypothetical protein [Ricinus communis]|uniref:Uncharacterized protein n=1 Tax=Ricinus communis TaxID=3988 RepID=B9SGJ8_RICCO|nr:conserved hypothetical protein [Ricinus communis]